LAAAFHQRNIVQRLVSPMRRLQVASSDGSISAVFHNLHDRVDAAIDGMPVPNGIPMERLGYTSEQVAEWARRHPDWCAKCCQACEQAGTAGNSAALKELDACTGLISQRAADD
jgi:hypothetical protein